MVVRIFDLEGTPRKCGELQLARMCRGSGGISHTGIVEEQPGSLVAGHFRPPNSRVILGFLEAQVRGQLVFNLRLINAKARTLSSVNRRFCGALAVPSQAIELSVGGCQKFGIGTPLSSSLPPSLPPPKAKKAFPASSFVRIA